MHADHTLGVHPSASVALLLSPLRGSRRARKSDFENRKSKILNGYCTKLRNPFRPNRSGKMRITRPCRRFSSIADNRASGDGIAPTSPGVASGPCSAESAAMHPEFLKSVQRGDAEATAPACRCASFRAVRGSVVKSASVLLDPSSTNDAASHRSLFQTVLSAKSVDHRLRWRIHGPAKRSAMTESARHNPRRVKAIDRPSSQISSCSASRLMRSPASELSSKPV